MKILILLVAVFISSSFASFTSLSGSDESGTNLSFSSGTNSPVATENSSLNTSNDHSIESINTQASPSSDVLEIFLLSSLVIALFFCVLWLIFKDKDATGTIDQL